MLRSRAKWNLMSDGYEEENHKNDIINMLLSQRGLHSQEEIAEFLSPELGQLQSPKDLAMMDKAANRIKESISRGEKILIYGDYDADGVSSTALLVKTVQELSGICDYYIPNRFKEGYGLNEKAITYAKKQNVKLIITVDTGISSFNEVDLATELGIDIIITDHHDVQNDHPNAYAIIHPSLSPQYNFKHLAGVGVAFKLAHYLLGYFPKHLLDLVAIGTIADLVPLQGENRVLAYYGLKQLSQSENIGLNALMRQCNITDDVSEEDVGFRIGPRINAVGRLTSAHLAVELLMTKDEDEAQTIVDEIEQLNGKRQQLVHNIVSEAEEQLENLGNQEVIFLAQQDWHEGVLGIVASRLANKYFRPTFILTIDESTNLLKGSARSIPAFHLFNQCMEVRDLFSSFGGHSQAAGMTLPMKNKEKLVQHLNNALEKLTEDELQETIDISQTLPLNSLTEDLIDQIYQLAPFGMDNPKPLFHIHETPQQINQIGRDKNHLKLQYTNGQQRFEGIGFNIGNLYNQIAPQTPISIVGELSVNEWNGFKNLQLIINDMKIDEWQLFDHRGKANIDIYDYIGNEAECLFVANNAQGLNNAQIIENHEIINYKDAVNTLEPITQLFLLDLPNEIAEIESLVKKIRPEQIHINFYVENSLYLQSFPTRDEFKWLYSYIFTKKSFNIKEQIPNIMQHKNWTKDQVIFMLHVFNDLSFITSESGMIQLATNPEKRELQDSKIYQQRKELTEVEKQLYYSNYKQLKQLFTKWLSETTEEEANDGLQRVHKNCTKLS